MTLYPQRRAEAFAEPDGHRPRRGNQALVSLVHFDIIVQHTPPGDVEIYESTGLKGCRVSGRTLNSAEGTDAEQVEIPLSIGELV